MTDKLKLGIAGIKPGDNALHGFAIAKDDTCIPLDDIELVAACDVREENVRGTRERSLFREVYTDYREMIEKADLDAVLIRLPTFLHKQATIDCLKAGLHVLCEKPPTCTYEEMLDVAKAARSSPGKYMFVRQSRFLPSVRAARRMVQEGKLGEVYCAESRWIRSRGKQILGNAWRSEKERGGGVLLDLGVHGIDQAWFAMDKPKPVEVTAATFTAFKQYATDPNTYSADDTVAGMIRFESGAVMECLFAFGMNAVGPQDPNQPDEPYATDWQVSRLFGTEGGLDIQREEFIRGSVDSVAVEPLPTNGYPSESPMVLQAREFIRAIRTDTTPLNSLDDALTLMRVLSGLMQSGETKRSVRLN